MPKKEAELSGHLYNQAGERKAAIVGGWEQGP